MTPISSAGPRMVELDAVGGAGSQLGWRLEPAAAKLGGKYQNPEKTCLRVQVQVGQ